MKASFHSDGSLPQGNAIFVFGSNLAGRHGKGAALIAKEKYGAIYGQGEGLQGQSYGIPTKDGRPGTPPLVSPSATLPLPTIAAAIERFIQFAQDRFDLQFHVTTIGCGLAGYKHSEIAPMFKNAPANCSLPDPWRAILDPMDCGKRIRETYIPPSDFLEF